MQTALTQIERALAVFAALFAVLGGLALVMLCGVTVVSVFYRYALNAPIFGVEDVSTMTLTVLVACSIVWAANQRGHVAVNILPIFMNRNLSRVTDAVARLLSAGVLTVAGYALFKKGGCGMPCGAITSNMSIVHTPFYYVLGAAMLVFAAMVAVQLAIGMIHWSGIDPNEVSD